VAVSIGLDAELLQLAERRKAWALGREKAVAAARVGVPPTASADELRKIIGPALERYVQASPDPLQGNDAIERFVRTYWDSDAATRSRFREDARRHLLQVLAGYFFACRGSFKQAPTKETCVDALASVSLMDGKIDAASTGFDGRDLWSDLCELYVLAESSKLDAATMFAEASERSSDSDAFGWRTPMRKFFLDVGGSAQARRLRIMGRFSRTMKWLRGA
jgi:hypothetical protein